MRAVAAFGGAIGFFSVLVLSAMFSGYTLSVLWGWFVVPTFHLPALALVPAMGIALVVSYLTHQIDAYRDPDGWEATLLKVVIYSISKPVLALFAGWIIHLFI